MPAKKSQKGFFPVVIPILVALVMVLGTIVFHYASKGKDNMSGDMSPQDVQALVNFFENIILTTEDTEAQNEAASQALHVVADYVKQEAPKILLIEYCNATIMDVFRAVQLAEQAIKAGLEKERIELLQWAKYAFRAMVPEMALSYGPKVFETHNNDELLQIKHEARKDLYGEARDIALKRDDLASLSQLLGLGDLAEQVVEGKYIQPMCIQLWDIHGEATYAYSREMSDYERWKQVVTIEDMPIYKADFELDIPYLTKRFEKNAALLDAEGAYFDGGQWVPYEFPKTVMWRIDLKGESHVNLWDYKITILVQPQLSYLSAVAGEGIHTNAQGLLENHEFEIPMLNFWKQNTFQTEKIVVYDDYGDTNEATLQLTFVPSGRITVDELRGMLK